MLYVIGKDFTGFELETLWDDGNLWLKHWRDFSNIAVVADQAWLRAAVNMFTPFFHGEVRTFGLSESDVSAIHCRGVNVGRRVLQPLSNDVQINRPRRSNRCP